MLNFYFYTHYIMTSKRSIKSWSNISHLLLYKLRGHISRYTLSITLYLKFNEPKAQR